jgi:hypothetical protein
MFIIQFGRCPMSCVTNFAALSQKWLWVMRLYVKLHGIRGEKVSGV